MPLWQPPTADEQTPLLRTHGNRTSVLQSYDEGNNPHHQFCMLVGVPPSDLPTGAKHVVGPKTLYGRATRQRSNQNTTYLLTASLSNMLLLSQVVLGAALTALGASESSHILITIFGAMNTIIAGLVAYLKSRGQPMRARMFRDDLERVVDEIENSEIMWLGISRGVHGYSDIDTDTEVTVRSEVARLTRLYDRAVRNDTINNPDMYMAGAGGEGAVAALRARPLPGAPNQPQIQVISAQPAPVAAAPVLPPAAAPAISIPDPDESPATKAPTTKVPTPAPASPVETPKEGTKAASPAEPAASKDEVQAGKEEKKAEEGPAKEEMKVVEGFASGSSDTGKDSAGSASGTSSSRSEEKKVADADSDEEDGGGGEQPSPKHSPEDDAL